MAIDWSDPKKHICHYCKHRGWTSYELTGEGTKHFCHCDHDGVERLEFSSSCEKWEPTTRFDPKPEPKEPEVRTLYLPLKKKWFDMIKSGVKKEEYRAIKPHYISRFFDCDERELDSSWSCLAAFPNTTKMVNDYLTTKMKRFDRVVFTLGYPKADDKERRLEFKNPRIRIGTGKKEWGADILVNYFVISWEA